MPEMSEETRKVLRAAVARMLRPLVRILLRHGMSFAEFSEYAKKVYVDVADEDFQLSGRKQTTSRISILTGLTRKEVQRLRTLEDGDDEAELKRYNRAARVISGWVRDHRFADAEGEPAVLPLEGAKASFTALVRAYSGDMPVRALLDELVRVGAVEVTDGGVRLLQAAYVPAGGPSDKLHILGADVADLIATIDHNLTATPETTRFQRKVSYDNLPAEVLPKLRKLSARESQSLLERLDRWLADHDRDTTPAVEGTGRKRAGLAIYYFEDDAESGD